MLKKFSLLSLAVVAVLSLSACATPTVTKTETPKEFYKSVVDTFCLLKGKSVITQKDVTAFHSLAKKMQAYKGENYKEVNATGGQVEELAQSYEPIVGKDLGPEVAAKHTQSCENVKAQYREKFGD